MHLELIEQLLILTELEAQILPHRIDHVAADRFRTRAVRRDVIGFSKARKRHNAVDNEVRFGLELSFRHIAAKTFRKRAHHDIVDCR